MSDIICILGDTVYGTVTFGYYENKATAHERVTQTTAVVARKASASGATTLKLDLTSNITFIFVTAVYGTGRMLRERCTMVFPRVVTRGAPYVIQELILGQHIRATR